MKKLLFVILSIILSLASCHKSDSENSALPDCIQEYIDSSINDPDAFVKMQKVDGEYYYWLGSGFYPIKNANCDIVCLYGHVTVPVPCYVDFDYNKWEIIWEP